VRQRRPRSVLCLPIIKQTKLVGALYLENNLTPRAFTSDRVAVLELLASQAAISLENALLYADLQQENSERKRAELALEDLAGKLIRAQEEERSRIGRELHDHISQMLGLLTMKIDQLRANEAIAPDVGGALEELRGDTSDITADVHRLSHRLHSSTLDYLGLVAALEKLVAEFSERHDIAITLTHALLPPSVPSDVALCLFRVAEESLTNIAKHSKARSAQVHVTRASDGIHLTVEDAGTGFEMAAFGSRAGLGFVSMQERLRILHGTIHVDSAPSRGTRIEAWVPATIVTNADDEAAPRTETT
jgi:signal transduction histidine kinase